MSALMEPKLDMAWIRVVGSAPILWAQALSAPLSAL